MEKEYTLKFSLSDLKIVSAALHELPYRLVAPLLERMAAQTIEQDKAAAEREAKALADLPDAKSVPLEEVSQ